MATILRVNTQNADWIVEMSDGSKITVKPQRDYKNKITHFTHPNGAILDLDFHKYLLEYCLKNAEQEMDIKSVQQRLERMDPPESDNNSGSKYKI